MRSTLDEPILAAIARLAPFAAATIILQNGFNQLDAWYLGRLGPDASNALGLFMMVQIATFGLVLVLARGTQSLVGRRLGAGQPRAAALAAAQGLGLAARLLVPLTVVLWFAAPQVMAFMEGRGAALEQATTFLRVLFLFMPALFAQPILDYVFQSLGDTRTPFAMQVLALAVNAALNWVLVLPREVALGGATWHFGGLGVAGSALATGLSRLLSASILFALLVRRYGWAELLERASYRPDGRVVREILRVGLPAGAATLAYAVVGVLVMKIIGRIDADAAGGYGIAFRGIETFSFALLLGVSSATATVTAHAAGAGDFARVRRAGHVGLGVGLGCMALTGLAILLGRHALPSIYSSDPRQLAIAADYLLVMAFCQVPQAFETVYSDAMAGAGSTLRTLLISMPGNALRIPLAWWLGLSLGLGLRGVWYAILASALCKGAGVTALYLSGRWEAAARHGRRMAQLT